MVQVRWRGLPDSEDTLKYVSKIYEDILQLFKKLLLRQNIPIALANKAHREIRL